MKYFVLALLLTLPVAGCSSLARPNPERLFAEDQAACDAYGFKRGTDYFAQCMQIRAESRAADDREARSRFAASMRQLSANLSASQPVTCHSNGTAQVTGFGNTVYGSSTTTCY